ncbi:MAG TPA: histidine kinase, partial [Candidatus Pelethocola excrementipullorum]|nr:histidine kinase [Candidatus Pelethocola excrementipullorum]
MKVHFKSIRYKFIASMIVIFLLFASIVLMIWYKELKKEAEATAIQNMEHMLQVSNTIFENQVQDIINVTALSTVRSGNYLSTNIINIMSRDDLTNSEIIDYRKTATDYLISLCSFKKNLNGVMLSDFNGNNIIYGVPTPYEMLLEEGWVSQIKTEDKQNLFLIPHYPNKWYQTDKDLVFSVLRPVYGFSGESIGFAIADISCQLFHDCYDANSTASSSLYVIHNTDGKVLFSPSQDLLHMESQSWAGKEMIENFTSNAGHFFTYNDAGEKMLAVYHNSDLTGWTTLSIIPEKEIVSTFTNTAHKILIITAILVLILIISVFMATSLLTKNIRILTKAVEGVNGEHLELRTPIRSGDEIGALYQQFQAMLKRIKELLNAVKDEEAAKHKAEIDALQFQMNPHFLYNSLNTIKFLSNIQGVENIGEVAESLSSLMHINMDGRSFITIEEDIDFITSYLKIQNYRFTNTFNYRISASLDINQYLVPKLLVQPLVENALKHGLKEKISGGILLIDYLIDDGRLK